MPVLFPFCSSLYHMHTAAILPFSRSQTQFHLPKPPFRTKIQPVSIFPIHHIGVNIMNLNMQAFNINTLLGGLDKVRDVMGVYQQQLLLIVIVFALLNCFFGYALRKLWSVIPGIFSRRGRWLCSGYLHESDHDDHPGACRRHRSSDRNHCLRPLPDRTFFF